MKCDGSHQLMSSQIAEFSDQKFLGGFLNVFFEGLPKELVTSPLDGAIVVLVVVILQISVVDLLELVNQDLD